MIRDDTIEEVRSRADIVEVIGDFVSLKRVGNDYKGKSPFTDEKTPSFFVVPSKGIFKDFSSGKGGDVFAFLMEHEGMTYPEAIRHLAVKYSIEIEEDSAYRNNTVDQNLKSALYTCMDFAKQYYQSHLLQSKKELSVGLDYLRKRGFTDETIHAFELGYAPDDWEQFSRQALRKGYSETLLEQAGLVVKKVGRNTHDLFRNRILFPIHDLLGKTIAFGARILDLNDRQPKYINSPETAIYHKGHVLYGLLQAKNLIRKTDNCYLVEGYTDVMSMHQEGVQNTVSPLGTALTKHHIRLIKRFTNHITLLLDGDPAGIRATIRNIELILEEGLEVRIVPLPDEHDPASYISQEGNASFKAYLNTNKKDFIQFQADLYAAEMAANPDRKAEIIGVLIHSVALVPDPIKRSLYLKQISSIFTVNEALLVATLNKKIASPQKTLAKKSTDHTDVPSHGRVALPTDILDPQAMIHFQERETIRLLLNYAEAKCETQNLAQFMKNELEDVVFTHPTYKEIYETFTTNWAIDTSVDSQYFFREGSETVKEVVSELLVPRHTVSPNWKKKYHIVFLEESDMLPETAKSNVLRLKLRIVQRMAQQHRIKIKEAEEQGCDSEEMDRLLDGQMNLNRARKQLSEYLGIVVIQ